MVILPFSLFMTNSSPESVIYSNRHENQTNNKEALIQSILLVRMEQDGTGWCHTHSKVLFQHKLNKGIIILSCTIELSHDFKLAL